MISLLFSDLLFFYFFVVDLFVYFIAFFVVNFLLFFFVDCFV